MFRTVTQDLRLAKNYRETVLKRSQYGSIRNLSLTEVPQFTLTLIKGYHLKKNLFCAILSTSKIAIPYPPEAAISRSHVLQKVDLKIFGNFLRKYSSQSY